MTFHLGAILLMICPSYPAVIVAIADIPLLRISKPKSQQLSRKPTAISLTHCICEIVEKTRKDTHSIVRELHHYFCFFFLVLISFHHPSSDSSLLALQGILHTFLCQASIHITLQAPPCRPDNLESGCRECSATPKMSLYCLGLVCLLWEPWSGRSYSLNLMASQPYSVPTIPRTL
jgi:hypothetical protein